MVNFDIHEDDRIESQVFLCVRDNTGGTLGAEFTPEQGVLLQDLLSRHICQTIALRAHLDELQLSHSFASTPKIPSVASMVNAISASAM